MTVQKVALLLFVIVLSAFSFPTAAQDQKTSICDPVGPRDRNDNAEPIRNIFRATGFMTTYVCETADDNSRPLAEHYTRWIIEPAPLSHLHGQRRYEMEGRGPLRKLFSDRVIETSYLLEITISAPDAKFTIPLSSFKYNEEGESGTEYTTNLRNNAFNQTYFRVNSNTTTNIVARAQHSFRTGYSGATEVLSAVQNVVNLVSPSSTLLTSVNAEQFSSTSDAISAIARSLFDNSFDETIEEGFGLDRWHEDGRVLIVMRLPHEITSHKRNTGRASSDEPIFLSYWLRLECPRASMFSSSDLCADQSLTSPKPSTAAILGFRLAANKSIQQHLDDQQWYREFLTSEVFRNANGTGRQIMMTSFCRSVAAEFYKVGFNATDTRMIVRSVIDGMPELARISTELRTECGDSDSFGLSELAA